MIDGISSRPAPPPLAGSGDAAPVARAAPPARSVALRTEPQAAAVDAVAPAIDVDRVAALRAAIANGSYRADPIAIAQRIIAADQPSLPATNSG